MASFTKHDTGWRAHVYSHGHRATKVFPTKKEAQAWATKKEAELSGKGGKFYSLQTAIERYLETVSPQKRDAVGWETRRFAELESHFGADTPLADITSDSMARFRDKLLKRVSGSTVVRYFNLYRNLFSIARDEWKWIERSPFTGLKLPKENAPRLAHIWRWQQIKRVLREGQRRGGKTGEVTHAFHIALRTAMRLQEALSFTFDARRRVAVIPVSKTSTKPEDIPLTRQACRLLAAAPVFTVDSNEASTLFSDLCRELLIEGLQFRDSRATALTLLARKVDILTLARISRHKDLDLLRSTYYRETAEEISRRLS